jgi:hypothetical protein
MSIQPEQGKRLVYDCEVADRKILLVPMNTIRFTPYNPSARTKAGAKLVELKRQIEKHGLICPVVITPDRDLIDGNRRATVWRDLGHSHIECFVVDADRHELFTDINTSGVALGGKGWLEMAFKGGRLSPSRQKQYEELLSLVGSWGVELLIRNGLGLNVLGLCKSVAALSREFSMADLLMKCAERKLTNKFNAVIRSKAETAEKVEQIRELLT